MYDDDIKSLYLRYRILCFFKKWYLIGKLFWGVWINFFSLCSVNYFLKDILYFNFIIYKIDMW